MNAMVFDFPGRPLKYTQMPIPEPGPKQVLVKIHACGVCRTDIHILDGELSKPKLQLIPGHEIVGTVVKAGNGAVRYKPGDRIGVPWLGYTCGECFFCTNRKENLCDKPLFTGYTINGGFAEYTVAYEDYCFSIPSVYSDTEAAPLLCAGLIGYRSYRMIDPQCKSIGIFGFGAAAHIITQIAAADGKEIHAFTRPGDKKAQSFALSMGATSASDAGDFQAETLDAAIIFAPVGSLILDALKALKKGGMVICGGIHMSDIPTFSYDLLWGERSIKSVANLQRKDGEDLMKIVAKKPIKTHITEFALSKTNEAIDLLRQGKVEGAVVLRMD
jgi:propanol-preferring alcohol dehydrogenase